MATWIFLEGIDKTGKSDVANKFKEIGFEVVHENNPSPYLDPTYIGPTYFEHFMLKLPEYANKNIVFDRSFFTEMFGYPQTYNRESCLSEEDVNIIIEDFLYQHEVHKFCMVDLDVESHWKRCVQFKEPLDRHQFNKLISYQTSACKKWGFEAKTLQNFTPEFLSQFKPKTETKTEPKIEKLSMPKVTPPESLRPIKREYTEKLERGLVIQELMDRRILPNKSKYDSIEVKVKDFLYSLLQTEVFSEVKPESTFTQEEESTLKQFARGLLSKAKGNIK